MSEIEARESYPELENDHIGMRLLWCSVIAQAINDATTSRPNSHIQRPNILRAREWIMTLAGGFEQACELAGYEADRIRAQVAPRIAEAQKHDVIVEPKPRKPRKPRTPSTARVKREGRPAQRYEYNGKALTILEWCKETGLSKNTIGMRLYNGWPIERVLTTPQCRVRRQHTDKDAA